MTFLVEASTETPYINERARIQCAVEFSTQMWTIKSAHYFCVNTVLKF